MYLARVIGQVVASKKDPEMHGRKLVILRPQLVNSEATSAFDQGKNTIVAVDSLGAGEGDMVLFVQGGSARLCQGMKTLPIDAAVIGIVDSVHVEGKKTFPAKGN